MNEIITTAPKRQAPWVGIGKSGEWHDYRDALSAAGLDFTVRAERAKVELPCAPMPAASPSFGMLTTVFEDVPNTIVNIREQDNKILGVVSDNYAIVQNADAFSLLDPFTAAGGVIQHAGMTEQGLVFMVLHIRKENMLGDDWDFDVMCTNSFNGSFPCALMMVPTRIICQNMYRKLMGNNDALLHVRHGAHANCRLSAATSATSGVMGYIAAFEHTLELANEKQFSHAGVENILLPMLFPYPKEGGKREVTYKAKVDELREEFMDRYYDASDNRKYHGKALGFINAYYDYLSHHDPSKNMPGSWTDRRLSGLINGNDIKTNVIRKVL